MLDRDAETTVHKQEVIYVLLIAAVAITLGLRQGHSLIVSFLNGLFLSCKISIQTSASRCPSPIAELLVGSILICFCFTADYFFAHVYSVVVACVA